MGLTLDAGALLAVERADRAVLALIKRTQRRGQLVSLPSVVLAQVWRGGPDRQVPLARLLRGCDTTPVTVSAGRRAGLLLGAAGTSDVVDALVVLHAADREDRVLTSDPADLRLLADALGQRLAIIPIREQARDEPAKREG